jgi:hypothetical protein
MKTKKWQKKWGHPLKGTLSRHISPHQKGVEKNQQSESKNSDIKHKSLYNG